MSKIEIGDIFEIRTDNGTGYFQCVKTDNQRGDLIKVFNKLYDHRPVPINSVLDINDHYYISFPLAAANKRRLVEKVGAATLPDDFTPPKYMREKRVINGVLEGWHIVDVNTLRRQFVETLSQEQRQLSPLGIYNDTLLKEMLQRGWNLENW